MNLCIPDSTCGNIRRRLRAECHRVRGLGHSLSGELVYTVGEISRRRVDVRMLQETHQEMR